MDLVSRLKMYLESRGISVTQFADECGIPRPTGSQLLAGRNKKVSDEIIGKIHAAYPDLNVVWLMFGEGNMEVSSNIQTSEPQNDQIRPISQQHNPENQPSDPPQSFVRNMPEPRGEKISYHTEGDEPKKNPTIPGLGFENTFVFASPADTHIPLESGSIKSPDSSTDYPGENGQSDAHGQEEGEPITLTPGKGKRVTGIVVYYDDCTYESFVPDPNHSHPFIAR